MKKISNKIKVLIIVIIILLIAGIAVVATKGFNVGLKYNETKKVEIEIGKDFENSDIKKITNEVLSNQPTIIQKSQLNQNDVTITAKEITDEQKTNLVSKINEKYGTEINVDDVQVQLVPHARLRDLVKPYILPFAIATVIIVIYAAIRFHKLGAIKTAIKTIFFLILTQGILASIIAIIRLPIGRTTMILVIAVYMLTATGLICNWEKKLKQKKQESDIKNA